MIQQICINYFCLCDDQNFHKKPTMSSNNNQNAPSSGRKKRSYKDLPIELRDISPKDITSITCAVELDKTTDKEILMAQRIVRGDKTIELSSLNVDQLRLLCRRLGITGSSSSKRAMTL